VAATIRARRLVISTAFIAAVLGSAILPAGAQAAPGDLDPTFSGDGKQTTDFGGSSEAKAVAIQPDAKVVVVGSTFGDFALALARYNPNGSLDTSFSGDGRQTTEFGVANAVALQANGKIVLVGSIDGGGFALARYNPNGTLDTSFSGDGKQTTDFGNSDEATGVAIQGNGKIVVVGTATSSTGANPEFAVARYNPNGSLDTSFSSDGKQRTAFGACCEGANGVALQGDGKIVAVGASGAGATGEDFALARYNHNGSLDTSFSGDGKQRTDFGLNSNEATGVAIQANGKIVAVGETGPNHGEGDFAIARYNPNGTLDTSFSGDGEQTTAGPYFFDAKGVAIQNDGKIVAVGGAFALARYNPNGSLDTSFSGDGKRASDFDGSASAVSIQVNGKIVAVGRTTGPAVGTGDFALARYKPSGTPDAGFSGDGKQTTDFGGSDGAADVALQGDGKIIVVGSGFTVTRYKSNGTLDTSFSGDGKQTTEFDLGGGQVANAVVVQDDGKILVVGTASGPMFDEEFAIARYNPNGSLDTSFSGDGKQTASFLTTAEANGVVIQGDGKIVVVGTGVDNIDGGSEGALARYNPNGTLDTSFSGDGTQTTDFGLGEGAQATGAAIQGNGKLVVVGSAGANNISQDLALARYNADGSLDTSFSGDGTQTTDLGGSDEAADVALQGDGKIVAAGIASGGATGDDFALARYNPDGSLDTGFSGDGMQTTDFGFGADDEANGVVLQGDGKIVAAGVASGGPTGDDFALARYDADGSLDTSFSGDGKRRTNFGGVDMANGVALQGDGKIVAVGRGLGFDETSDFALARYLGG
jgi:uncharacterized delta-60 repeat protein